MLKKALIAGAVLAAAFGAQAQSSADFGFGGTITPGACTVTIGGGNLASYGTLTQGYVKSLPIGLGSTGNLYALPIRTTTLKVTCTAPVAVALAFTDNRAANRFNPTADANDPQRYGVANTHVAGQRLGNYALGWKGGTAALTVNGGVAIADLLVAPNGALTSWSSATTFSGGRLAPGYTYGPIVAAANTQPDQVTSIEGTLEYRPALDKSIIDNMTSNIDMDASGTAVLVYV